MITESFASSVFSVAIKLENKLWVNRHSVTLHQLKSRSQANLPTSRMFEVFYYTLKKELTPFLSYFLHI